MRTCTVQRTTKKRISLIAVNLDGTGDYSRCPRDRFPRPYGRTILSRHSLIDISMTVKAVAHRPASYGRIRRSRSAKPWRRRSATSAVSPATVKPMRRWIEQLTAASSISQGIHRLKSTFSQPQLRRDGYRTVSRTGSTALPRPPGSRCTSKPFMRTTPYCGERLKRWPRALRLRDRDRPAQGRRDSVDQGAGAVLDAIA